MDAVLAALAKAADSGLLPRQSSILLAVSGGADSMALLHGCAEIARETGWSLSVGHVHHGWRGREADRDLIFVREHSRRLGLPFFHRLRDAPREARHRKLSPESAARLVRYEALREMADEDGSARISTAHQQDDALECLLLARRRKAGLGRLAGPQRERADGVVRPLLEVSRGQILAFLRSRGAGFRRDASNGDLHLDRNRIRRELSGLPREERDATLGRLLRELETLAAERESLDREFSEHVRPRICRGPGSVIADALYLASCSPALQRQAIEAAAAPFAAPGHAPLTGREREQVLQRLAEGKDFRFEAGRRIRFERRGPILSVRPRPPFRRDSLYDSPQPLSSKEKTTWANRI